MCTKGVIDSLPLLHGLAACHALKSMPASSKPSNGEGGGWWQGPDTICEYASLANVLPRLALPLTAGGEARVDEALELVKELARKHGSMQQHTLNSVVRALAVDHVERALRMLSLMRTLGQRPSYATYLALITATARASRSVESHRLYW